MLLAIPNVVTQDLRAMTPMTWIVRLSENEDGLDEDTLPSASHPMVPRGTRKKCRGAVAMEPSMPRLSKNQKVGHHKHKAHFPRGDVVTNFTTFDPPPPLQKYLAIIKTIVLHGIGFQHFHNR